MPYRKTKNRPLDGIPRNMTLEEISPLLGISREGVSRIEKRAMYKIESYLRARRIKKEDILPD